MTKQLELQFHDRQIIEEMLKVPNTTLGNIAKALDRSHSGIKLEVKRNGGKDCYNAREAQERTEIARRAAALKKTKPLPEYAKEKALSMIEAGESMNAISKATGIGHYRLRNYLTRENIKIGNHSNKSILERLEIIEQQLEIIFDILKTK